MSKIQIQMNLGNALKRLGKLYNNPAEAIKEHISNAIDEHMKAKFAGCAVDVCEVDFKLEKDKVTIEYPYGMSYEEFKNALNSVADSNKKDMQLQQIGRLGIGMFSFSQIGRKCEFYSRKSDETIKVVLHEGGEEADINLTPKKQEQLEKPGIKIILSGLYVDPTEKRSQLSPNRLKKVFSEKYYSFLQKGTLKIRITCNKELCNVEPAKIELPKVGAAYKEWNVRKDRTKKICLELFYDESGKGKVCIRHSGVTVIEDIGAISAYGVEESMLGSGEIMGFIDADFLAPNPARSIFEENNDWIEFIDELLKIIPAIEAEVEDLKEKESQKKLSEIQKQAVQMAQDILNMEEFNELMLLDGMGRSRGEAKLPPNGFDFIPASLRIQKEKMGTLHLKSLVPKVIPNGSQVKIEVSNNDCIDVRMEDLFVYLKKSDADRQGVVSTTIHISAKEETTEPVVVKASTGKYETFAKVRVSPIEQEREKPTGTENKGRGINYTEKPFEDGPSKHSRYFPASRIVEINELNKDYREMQQNEEDKLAYAVMMIMKETTAINYPPKENADECLEKMLSFLFEVKRRISLSPKRKKRKTQILPI
jgi:hypothetical protein